MQINCLPAVQQTSECESRWGWLPYLQVSSAGPPPSRQLHPADFPWFKAASASDKMPGPRRMAHDQSSVDSRDSSRRADWMQQAVGTPVGRSWALMSWVLPRVTNRRRHAMEYPAMHISLRRQPQQMQCSKEGPKATGDLYPLNELPERRMSASMCLVCLRTQGPLVSTRT